MFEKYNIQHQNQTEKDVRYLETLYTQVITLVALYVYQSVNTLSSNAFEFAQFAALSAKVNRLMKEFAGRVETHIAQAVQAHWNFSNKKYDTRAEVWGLRSKPAPHTPYTSKLKLSDRVWRNTQQLREELEMAIDVAYKKGTSAQELARQIKKYLNEPDKLFRHYRDKNGAMQLSKKAAAYHPGAGVYRSSLKNAERLARTEINMAYRTADMERMQQLDFVIGYEIKRSRHPYPCKICDMMQGKYPKDFQWLGNHPNCRCYVVPIIQQGAEATAVEMNPKFTQWLSENADRLNDNNLPMFLWGDNKEVTNIISAKKLMQKASAASIEVETLSKSVAEKFKGFTTEVNLKSEQSILRKVTNEYNGDFSLVKDAVRTTIIIPENKMQECFDYLQKSSIFARIKKQAPEKHLGYSGILTNINTSQGVMAEVQVNTAKMIYAKEKPSSAIRIIGKERWQQIKNEVGVEGGLGHKYYEEYRVLDKNIPAELKRMKELEKLSFDYYNNFR